MKAQMNLLDEIIVDNFAGGGGASWQEWKWVAKSFQLKTYIIGIDDNAIPQITPSVNSPSRYQDRWNLWHMRSGYGITYDYSPAYTNGGWDMAPSSSYTIAQAGNVYFGDFMYSNSTGEYRTDDWYAR